ncbi:MAG: hypothetical protein KBT77_08035 [Thalassolituus oleivorans]|uniref:hypothetical protein n=1 Tax=Thalassolituus oleivorans TaxID=187493 RepID=UPI001B76D5D8|nr:hypothetical protein [Thalassolituus oleivorans]MBQ0727283.1 hypothetical protein [Thalassolituus oleivorans]
MNMTPRERVKLLMNEEDLRAPWLEKRTGIGKERWRTVKNGKAAVRADEIEELAKIYPEYGYWLATGLELPEAGQISPMTKNAQRS